jgi:hypothetical protein
MFHAQKYFNFSISKDGRWVVADWKDNGKRHDSAPLVNPCVDGALRVNTIFLSGIFAGMESWLLEQGFAPAVEIEDRDYFFNTTFTWQGFMAGPAPIWSQPVKPISMQS